MDSGEGQNATNTVRASLYDRISTHDQQTLPMQIRGPGDKSSSLAWENLAMREYAAPAWLDHRPAGERSRLWSFPAATAAEVALKDIASHLNGPCPVCTQRLLNQAHRQNSLRALFSSFVKIVSRSCSANPLKSIAGSAYPVAQDGVA